MPIHFVRMDIEGAEVQAVEGMRQTIQAYSPLLLIELHFPTKLMFYRKGCEYYVEITGTAVVVNKQDVMFGTNNVYGGKLLLKMVPYYIEYTETGKRDAGFKKLKSQMYDVFMNTLGLSRATQPRLTELH